MNKQYPIHLLAVVMALLVMILGCGVRPADQEQAATKATEWTPAKDLEVFRLDNLVEGQTLILVDLSKSNTSKPDMWAEVKAQVAKVGDLDEVCVLQISEDSSATSSQPWCRGILDPFTCTHYPIKEGNWTSVTREKREYVEAKARIEREMKQCEAERQVEQSRRTVQAKAGLESWIKVARDTQFTDIQGAFSRAVGMKDDGADSMEVWVYSDMEDDPLVKRSEPLTLSLADQKVHVRRLARSGAGYDSTWQTKWESVFKGWGNPTVDWKDFRQGEFGEPDPVVVEAAPVPTPAVSTGGNPFPDKPGARH